MRTKCFLPLLILLIISFSSNPQTKSEYSVLFYNVENLFDVDDDPATDDEEFTPDGDRHWTYNRYRQKILNISKVILNASGWSSPEMIGLCEVENRNVMESLLKETPLKSFPYKIIHKQSPDNRGIDVAFIYNEQIFNPIEYEYFPIKTQDEHILKTREILYVSGILDKIDTLHLFFNHWPSRYSGLLKTKYLRILAAQRLHEIIKDLSLKIKDPKIIIMGDFNDQPFDESIRMHLVGKKISDEILPQNLYNLANDWVNKEPGTLKYRSQWSVFDQIIVSGKLLQSGEAIYTSKELAYIVQLPFLIEKDERYGGLKPARTYTGYNYNGGFSDHLPVLLKLENN